MFKLMMPKGMVQKELKVQITGDVHMVKRGVYGNFYIGKSP